MNKRTVGSEVLIGLHCIITSVRPEPSTEMYFYTPYQAIANCGEALCDAQEGYTLLCIILKGTFTGMIISRKK